MPISQWGLVLTQPIVTKGKANVSGMKDTEVRES